MPEKTTVQRARRLKREGKRPTTQAGAFVREEMHHVREGRHGASSRKQAIAIGLSKARKSGVKIPPRGRARSHSASVRGGVRRGKTVRTAQRTRRSAKA